MLLYLTALSIIVYLAKIFSLKRQVWLSYLYCAFSPFKKYYSCHCCVSSYWLAQNHLSLIIYFGIFCTWLILCNKTLQIKISENFPHLVQVLRWLVKSRQEMHTFPKWLQGRAWYVWCFLNFLWLAEASHRKLAEDCLINPVKRFVSLWWWTWRSSTRQSCISSKGP